MKEIISKISGRLQGRAIQKGMKSADHPYDFGNYEVRCYVQITEESINTCFRVYPMVFADECVYETNSFKDLREWLRRNIDEIN